MARTGRASASATVGGLRMAATARLRRPTIYLASLCLQPRPDTLGDVFRAGMRAGVNLADRVAKGEITLADALAHLEDGQID